MIHFRRTDAQDPDFALLVTALDLDLAERDGPDHAFFAQFNSLEQIKQVILVYEDQYAVGCGAIKAYDAHTCEVKRIYLRPIYRGRGLASRILHSLEDWAKELAFQQCILETGYNQPEAIRLYEKNQYQRIENYGPYQGIDKSICFGKSLVKS